MQLKYRGGEKINPYKKTRLSLYRFQLFYKYNWFMCFLKYLLTRRNSPPIPIQLRKIFCFRLKNLIFADFKAFTHPSPSADASLSYKNLKWPRRIQIHPTLVVAIDIQKYYLHAINFKYIYVLILIN